jgi:hypothetical protein
MRKLEFGRWKTWAGELISHYSLDSMLELTHKVSISLTSSRIQFHSETPWFYILFVDPLNLECHTQSNCNWKNIVRKKPYCESDKRRNVVVVCMKLKEFGEENNKESETMSSWGGYCLLLAWDGIALCNRRYFYNANIRRDAKGREASISSFSIRISIYLNKDNKIWAPANKEWG